MGLGPLIGDGGSGAFGGDGVGGVREPRMPGTLGELYYRARTRRRITT
jgi:hypothetical protein